MTMPKARDEVNRVPTIPASVISARAKAAAAEAAAGAKKDAGDMEVKGVLVVRVRSGDLRFSTKRGIYSPDVVPGIANISKRSSEHVTQPQSGTSLRL